MADAPERTDIYTPEEIEWFADKMLSVGANPFKSLWKGGKALATIMHLQGRVASLEQERVDLINENSILAKASEVWRVENARLREATREAYDRLDPNSLAADILESALDGSYRRATAEGENDDGVV